VCSECGKAFSYYSSFHRHRRTHQAVTLNAELEETS
jgi:KRAB domain-containing zinc finger protein